MIRVLIADDHAVVREGIRHVLAPAEGFDVIGEATDGARAVELARELQPDVVVLDLTMPVLSGLDAAERIRGVSPDSRILVLSIHEHGEYAARSRRAGALGYLRKDSSPAELRSAIRAIAEGKPHFASEDAPPLAAGVDRLAPLTSRERNVLREIARGSSNKEIAARLEISVRTVESHRESLMRKLNLKGTAALTRFALDCGILD
jgi:two-component system nitrate/nitrite response regulator NarL